MDPIVQARRSVGRFARKNLGAKAAVKDDFLWSQDQTPWIESLRWEYEKDGLDAWDNKKVFRACELFNCTIYEFCALVGLFDRIVVSKYIGTNHWPMYLTLQWNKLVRFRTGLRKCPDIQDMVTAKFICGHGHEGKEKAAA